MTDLLDDLRWRGLLYQSTDEDELRRHLGQPRRFYCGFDPSSDSLTIGNLLPMTLMQRVGLAGHTPVVLFGGATGLIGDPSGKSAERSLLSREQVQHNVSRHREIFERYFAGVDADVEYVNNADWLGPLPLIDFLRDAGKYFSVNELLRRESIRTRLETAEQTLSFTEFSYTLLQAYDFAHLNRQRQVTLQLGASDQWGNIVGGVDLIRRLGGGEAHALTCPLLLRADGTKFGKSEKGAVWLSADRTSPYQFFQFLMNLDDDTAKMFLRYFSLQPREAIEATVAEADAAPGTRVAQRAIATELTERLHGSEARARAESITEALFYGDVAALPADALSEGLADLPRLEVTRSELEAGLALLDLVVRSGLAASKRAGRELISSRAIRLNGQVEPEDRPVGPDDLLHDEALLLRRGKREYAAVWMTD